MISTTLSVTEIAHALGQRQDEVHEDPICRRVINDIYNECRVFIERRASEFFKLSHGASGWSDNAKLGVYPIGEGHLCFRVGVIGLDQPLYVASADYKVYVELADQFQSASTLLSKMSEKELNAVLSAIRDS